MIFRPSEAAARLGPWLLGSSIAAELAHAAIDALGRAGLGGSAYAGHPHGTWTALAMALLIFGSTAICARLGRALRNGVAPVTRPARPFGRALPLGIVASLAGTFGLLVAMEFSEQYGASGRIDGLGDVLGGNPSVGFATVLGVAVCAALFRRWFTSPLERTIGAAVGLLERFTAAFATGRVPSAAVASVRRSQSTRRANRMTERTGRLALRAPPPSIRNF